LYILLFSIIIFQIIAMNPSPIALSDCAGLSCTVLVSLLE